MLAHTRVSALLFDSPHLLFVVCTIALEGEKDRSKLVVHNGCTICLQDELDLHKATRRECLAAVQRLLSEGTCPDLLDDEVWSHFKLQLLCFAVDNPNVLERGFLGSISNQLDNQLWVTLNQVQLTPNLTSSTSNMSHKFILLHHTGLDGI